MSRRTTVAFAVLLGIVVMLATALTAVATRDPFSGKRVAPDGTPVVHVDAAIQDRSVPTLNPAQQQRATDLATSSQAVGPKLAGAAARVGTVVPWTTTYGEVIGAVVTLRLPQARDIDGEWLAIQYDPEEKASPPYQSVPYRAHHANVTALVVFIDLQRGAVVGLTPDPDSTVVGTPEVPSGAPNITTPSD